jgi:hypothetical protein
MDTTELSASQNALKLLQGTGWSSSLSLLRRTSPFMAQGGERSPSAIGAEPPLRAGEASPNDPDRPLARRWSCKHRSDTTSCARRQTGPTADHAINMITSPLHRHEPAAGEVVW